MKKTMAEMLLAFVHCVRAGQHDFSQGDVCTRCGAHKGDANLLDVIGHARVKKENPYAQ
jgi:hypothetical protein